MTRVFPGTLDAAVEAEAWARAECERLRLGADTTFALMLCVEELFVNAVGHGGAREIRLALAHDGLEFCDDGAAFDPTRPPSRHGAKPEVGGFGLALLQRFANGLAYARKDGCNIVTLAFRRANEDLDATSSQR